MNYNPLENEKCLYDIEDIYKIKIHKYEDDDYEFVSVEKTKDLDRKEAYRNGYNYLLKSITDKIEWFIEAGLEDYQGDIYYLGVDEEGRYYFLPQGYGSCSGCDAYDGAEYDCQHDRNLVSLDRLRDSMKRHIIQFENLEEFKEYLCGEYTKGSFYYYSLDMKDFIEKLNREFGWNLKWKEWELEI